MKRDGWARAGQRAHREAATAWEATAAARQAATEERQMLLEARAAAGMGHMPWDWTWTRSGEVRGMEAKKDALGVK